MSYVFDLHLFPKLSCSQSFNISLPPLQHYSFKESGLKEQEACLTTF